jgi:hypothetical protein
MYVWHLLVWIIKTYRYLVKEGFLCSLRPVRLWGPPSLLFNQYRCYCPRVKRAGLEVDHLLSSTAEVKKG